MKRTDILTISPVRIHDEYILILQYLGCRQVAGYLDRHKATSFSLGK